MANRSLLRLRLNIRQNKFVYILIMLTIVILFGYRDPQKLRKQNLNARDSARSLYARFNNSISNERISGLYTVWRKLTAIDTVVDKLENPLEPIGGAGHRSRAMQEGEDITQRVEQLTDRYVCLMDFKRFENLFEYNKPRLWVVDQEPKGISLENSPNYCWIFNRNVTLRVGKNLNILRDETVGELDLRLANFPRDTMVTFKVPVAEAGADLLIESSDPHIYVTVGIHPIRVRECMTGHTILPSAVVYQHYRTDSGYVAETGAAGIDIDAPFKQYIIPAHKRYTALILYYDNRETTSTIACANMDSVGQLPGIHHPSLPIMVAAVNQRQSLALNILSVVPGDNVNYSVVAATANRYHDLKDLYMWFVRNELGKIQHRGAPLSEANMELAARWINEQFEFKLTRKDSLALMRDYRYQADNE